MLAVTLWNGQYVVDQAWKRRVVQTTIRLADVLAEFRVQWYFRV